MRSLGCSGVAFAALVVAAAPAVAGCVTKSGSATGVTRGFAEYEAELIIRQVTGNWPIQSDKISAPVYACKQGDVLWTCKATAKVCKG